MQVLTDVALPFLVVLPVIGALLGLLLREQEQRVDDERALRESETRLREARSFLSTLIATIPDLVWLTDPDGVYLACNPRFEGLYGATEAEIKGRCSLDFVAAEEAAAFRQHDLDAIAAGGPILKQETLTFAADGHQEQVETIKTPMFDAEGRLVGVLGIARDISLLRHADQAMYQAKPSGKNTYHLHDAKQDQLLQVRRQRLERIGLALQQDELVLHFQPQVDMISREVIRAEALVRWQHPEQGLLMPANFLPDIEATELEVKLDQWVIEQDQRVGFFRPSPNRIA